MLKSAARALVNLLGFDIVRRANAPSLTWLGIRGRDIRLILDAGANIGQFAIEAHRVFPQARFICFEPLPDVAQTLTVNLAKSGIVARVVNVALSDAPGEASFHLHIGHSPSSSLLLTTEHGEILYPQMAAQDVVSVQVDTVDATPGIVDRDWVGEALLKLDVQGNELRVLRGARRTLSSIDHILCEANFDPLYQGQASFAELHDHLAGAGFRYAGALLQVCGPNGRVVFADELFTRRDLRSNRSP